MTRGWHKSRRRNLRSLNLSFTKISDDGLKHLKELAGLEVLSLGTVPITDRGMAELKRVGNLSRLNLLGTRVTADGVKELKDLTRLQTLEIVLDDRMLVALLENGMLHRCRGRGERRPTSRPS